MNSVRLFDILITLTITNMANTKDPRSTQGDTDVNKIEHHETGHEPIPDPPPPTALLKKIIIGGIIAAAVAVVIYLLTK